MKPVTLWYRLDHETKSYQYNHLEDGHSDREVPHAKFPEQLKSWSGDKWKKEHAHLDENNVVLRAKGEDKV